MSTSTKCWKLTIYRFKWFGKSTSIWANFWDKLTVFGIIHQQYIQDKARVRAHTMEDKTWIVGDRTLHACIHTEHKLFLMQNGVCVRRQHQRPQWRCTQIRNNFFSNMSQTSDVHRNRANILWMKNIEKSLFVSNSSQSLILVSANTCTESKQARTGAVRCARGKQNARASRGKLRNCICNSHCHVRIVDCVLGTV